MFNQMRNLFKDKTLIVGIFTAGTIYINNEKNLKLTERVHNKDHDLENKKYELQKEQLEFEKYKYQSTQDSGSVVTSEVNSIPKEDSVENVNSMVPSNSSSSTVQVQSIEIPLNSINETLSSSTYVDPTIIPNSLELLNILNSGILQSSSVAYIMFSISTLIATISILINSKMNEYGDTFEDKIPK